MIKKVSHAKGDLKVAFARMRDSPMANSKMSPARLMFRRILRFPGLPVLPDNLDEVVAEEEKQACTFPCRTTRPSCLTLRLRLSECVREEEVHTSKQRTEGEGWRPSSEIEGS